MATEERARQALYARLEEVIGEDHAATLMQYLPPDPSDLATKSDLRELRTGVDQRMDGLDQRMDRMERHMERFDDRLPDLRSAVREQTRVLVAISVGTMTTLSIVVFAAARLSEAWGRALEHKKRRARPGAFALRFFRVRRSPR